MMGSSGYLAWWSLCERGEDSTGASREKIPHKTTSTAPLCGHLSSVVLSNSLAAHAEMFLATSALR